MNIGITMRIIAGGNYPEEQDTLSRDWSDYAAKTLPGAVLIPLVNSGSYAAKAIRELKIDGIILSGGDNWGVSKRRDETEAEIVQSCLKYKIPILGVCRGMQALNILFGGTLEKDISAISKERHIAVVHEIDINRNSPFNSYAMHNSLKVNSFHAQGVITRGLSKQFNIFASSRKGVIEGIYHRSKPIMGIQWHPERKNTLASFDSKLITGLFSKGAFWR